MVTWIKKMEIVTPHSFTSQHRQEEGKLRYWDYLKTKESGSQPNGDPPRKSSSTSQEPSSLET